MSFRPLLICSALLLGLGVTAGCEESKGGFGDAPPPKSNVEKKRVVDEKRGDNETPPDFEKALKITSRYDQPSGKVVVKLAVQDGFHAYAPGNEIGVPVDISVKDEGGWKLGEKGIPAGEEKDLGELGKAKVLEGSFELTGAVTGGKGLIKGETMVQICTANVCDRPRQHGFEVPGPEA